MNTLNGRLPDFALSGCHPICEVSERGPSKKLWVASEGTMTNESAFLRSFENCGCNR